MKIAILGTGLMGSALTEAVIKAGHEAIVYNRTIVKTLPLVELGAKVAASPAEAITEADASIVLVLDGAGLKNLLLNDETKAAFAGKKIMNASTTNLADILETAEVVAKFGGSLAEMTINADNNMLRDAQGQFAIGCNAEEEKFWTELLLSIGTGAERIGKVGDATKAESTTLVASMFHLVTLAYATAIAQKLDVPKEIYEPLITMSVPNSEYQLPSMISHNYDTIFGAVDSYTTGLTTAISTAKFAGLPTAVLEEMLKLFKSAEERGFAKKDGSSVIEVLLKS